MAEEIKLTLLPDCDLPEAHELPGDLPLVAELIGVKNTMILVDGLRGTPVYFRNLDGLKRRLRNRSIRAEIDRRIENGELISNIVPDLARRWGVCVRTAWDIAGSSDESAEIDERQLGLFGARSEGR